MFSESTKVARSDAFVEEVVESSWQDQQIDLSGGGLKRAARIREHGWIIGLFVAFCDIAAWVCLYGLVAFVRRDEFFVSAFEFVLVDVIALAVLLQALYIIGGYNRNTETRSLTYTAEHILAVASAAAISSLINYAAAAYQDRIKTSGA